VNKIKIIVLFIIDDIYKMERFKNPSLTASYIEWLKEMEAIYYPVYASKDLLVQHYFEPTIAYLERMQELLGFDFYEIVKRDRKFIVEKEIWTNHRELIPYLFLPNELSRMQTLLDTNDYSTFVKALHQGAPLDVLFVDQLVKKSIYNNLININIYRLCLPFVSVDQFFDLIDALPRSLKHIKLILSEYPEYSIAVRDNKTPFYYVVKYKVPELVSDLYVGYFNNMYEIFMMSLDTPKIALFLVDKLSGFSDEQANLLIQEMIRRNLSAVCRQFSKLQFKVDFDTQILIMDYIDFFYILKDKFDLCGIRRFVVIKECMRRVKNDKRLKPMLDFYTKRLSANDLRDIKTYSLKF